MSSLRSLVLASGNPGKALEIRALLEPLGIHVVSQAELGISEAEEPHDTFLENALAKARHASRATGMPALADDSGLCVDALGGLPGVHSAYFAGREGGREARDARNNAKLLASLAHLVVGADRRAHYACVMVLVRRADDPEPLVAEGRWEGAIGTEPRGKNGFGYDPLFNVTDRLHLAGSSTARTAAELPPEEKNRVSHRGLALARLIERIRAEP
ncbi:MAG: RdgB/HAM1 family non-canonical purine NTP pyrophosphatase [Betaproteobacteria bacterium]